MLTVWGWQFCRQMLKACLVPLCLFSSVCVCYSSWSKGCGGDVYVIIVCLIFSSLGSHIFLKTDLNEMLRVSVPAECSYCLLDCSGIGNHSQGANINISLNLMNPLRNVIALTFNIYQIIENYMTPISHFDVHGTWAVYLTHLLPCDWSTLVQSDPLFQAFLADCNISLSSSWICFLATSNPSHKAAST